MSSIFRKLSQNLKQINVNQIALESVNLNDKDIIDLNTKKQLYQKGIDSDGKKLKRKGANYPIYSKGYENLKRKAGKYQGYVDLSLKGNFLKDFRLHLFDNYFIIQSSEISLDGGYDLAEILRDNYSDKIEGLTTDNIKKIADIILKDFIQIFKLDFNKALNSK